MTSNDPHDFDRLERPLHRPRPCPTCSRESRAVVDNRCLRCRTETGPATQTVQEPLEGQTRDTETGDADEAVSDAYRGSNEQLTIAGLPA